MIKAFAKLSALLLAILVIGSLAMPHICFASHNDQNGPSIEQQHKHDNKSAKAVDCCVAHHCCAGKILNTQSYTSATIADVANLVFSIQDQPIASLMLDGFDRPPKSIA